MEIINRISKIFLMLTIFVLLEYDHFIKIYYSSYFQYNIIIYGHNHLFYRFF